jgi:hypothetical protein
LTEIETHDGCCISLKQEKEEEEEEEEEEGKAHN